MNFPAILASLSTWIDLLLVRYRILEVHYPHLTTFASCAARTIAIVLLAWIAATLLRGHSARARCWVWRCAVPGLLAVLLPVIHPVVTARIRITLPVEPQQGQQEKAYIQIREWGLLPPAGFGETRWQERRAERIARDEPPWIVDRIDTVPLRTARDEITVPFWRQADTWISRIWAAGAALLVTIWLLRLCTGLLWLRRNARRPVPEVAQIARDVARELRLRSIPRLRQGPHINSPLLTGWLYPHIHLPPEANTWPVTQPRMVFLHELAHWKRMDMFWHHLGRLTSLLVWWNPLAAFASRRMMREAEEAADDVVILKHSRQMSADIIAATITQLEPLDALPPGALTPPASPGEALSPARP
ncbi:MAG: M56 family metallopeptidase [Opitutaceae bacterium]|jgi:hypothetical protein|nr:M56 family metallopeptidase [Opitutaceae bacterium]